MSSLAPLPARLASLLFSALLVAACGDEPEDPVFDGDGGASEIKVRVTPTSGLTTTERGEPVTFTVELTAEPRADVTISLHSSNEAEGDADVTDLVFTPEAWGPKTVLVKGVDDALHDGNQEFRIILDPTFSDDLRFHGLATGEVFVTNVDDETPSVTISTTANGSIAEAGGQITYEVRLGSQPRGDVRLPLESALPGRATTSVPELRFFPVAWDAVQTFTVTGVDDRVDLENQLALIKALPVESSDTDYLGLDPDDLEISLLDDDALGIKVSALAPEVLGEYPDDHATFTVVLESQPTATVTIPVASSSVTNATVSPSSLTFTAANWDQAQTVTVAGVTDYVDDGDKEVTIGLGPVTSPDAAYQALSPPSRKVTSSDWNTADVRATLNGEWPHTYEDAESVLYPCRNVYVSLGSKPSADVDVKVEVSDATEARLSTSTFHLGPFNWQYWAQRYVRVCGVDDSIDDGNQAYTVRVFVSATTDPQYVGLESTVALTNDDNDEAGFWTNTPNGYKTTEAGGTVTVEVKLDCQPAADVTVALRTDPASEGTVSPSTLVFTPENWNVKQLITATGQDDALDDGDEWFSIDGMTTSDDLAWNRSFWVTNLLNVDND